MRPDRVSVGEKIWPRSKSSIAISLRSFISGIAAEQHRLSVILILALLNGLLFIFVIPPWQHYDEPTHFEYAWLIANQGELPEVDEVDFPMRRQVAASMIEHGFFDGLGFLPDLESQEKPAWIGIQQLDEPPLYYLLVAIPLRWFNQADIDLQLYAGRMVSLVLYLVIILAGWGVVRELSSPTNPIRWLFPATLALFPPLGNLMTAVNNDSAAVAFFSVFIWVSFLLMSRGFSWYRFLLAGAFTALCYFTKNTAYLALPLFPIVLIFSLIKGQRKKWAWILLAGLSLVGLISILSWGDAATWYPSTLQEMPTRISHPKATVGRFVFQLETGAEVNPPWIRPLSHPIPAEKVDRLVGKTVTIGAWIWANEPLMTRSPMLYHNRDLYSEVIEVGMEPAFYAYQLTIPEDITRVWITLLPNVKDQPQDAVIFMDGLVLAEGARPVDQSPHFDTVFAQSGVWGDQPFENLIRNGSAEAGAPRVREWFNSFGKRLFPHYTLPSFTLSYLLDWEGVDWHFSLSVLRLFRTFWGEFGWGHVPLLGHKPYRVMGYFTLLGIVGALIYSFSRRHRLPWETILFFSLVLIGSWGGSLLRGVGHIVSYRIYFPVARYAFVAILPTVLILVLGWQRILFTLRHLFKQYEIPKSVFYALYFGLLICLSIYSFVSIIRFYYSS